MTTSTCTQMEVQKIGPKWRSCDGGLHPDGGLETLASYQWMGAIPLTGPHGGVLHNRCYSSSRRGLHNGYELVVLTMSPSGCYTLRSHPE